jgi:queuine tRNA-ribosyltransferase
MFQILKEDNLSKARVGKIETANGLIETPAIFIKAKKNKVRFIKSKELKNLKVQALEIDAYEIFEMLGEEGLNSITDVFDILKYRGPIISLSGAEHLFKLKELEIINSGINFEKKEKGIKDYFDSEISIKIQKELKSNIITAFYFPILENENHEKAINILENSIKWQLRSLEAISPKSDEKIYGVINLNNFDDLILKNSEILAKLPFDAFRIDNYFYNIKNENFQNIIQKVFEILPSQKPRHLNKIRSLKDIFLAVENGIDTLSFSPNLWSKNGILYAENQKIDLKNKNYENADLILDPNCLCPVCSSSISLDEIKNLFLKNDKKAFQYINEHNIYFLNNLMNLIRESILNGEFQKLKEYFLKTEK